MAMSMTDFFYGGCDSRRQFCSSESRPSRPDRCAVPTFELEVPMCCAACEEQAREALFDLEGVVDVASDPYKNRNRLFVTGYVDPVRALKRARHAALRSQSSHAHYPHVEVECLPSEMTYRDRGTHLQRGHSRQSHPSISGSPYSSSYCPSYRDSSSTNYMTLDTNNVQRVEYGY